MLREFGLSETEPGLEIITDDVKCSHGTTITNIDDDQVFYLTSRGIPQKEAEQLVIRRRSQTANNFSNTRTNSRFSARLN